MLLQENRHRYRGGLEVCQQHLGDGRRTLFVRGVPLEKEAAAAPQNCLAYRG
jgi:hypothetical protein